MIKPSLNHHSTPNLTKRVFAAVCGNTKEVLLRKQGVRFRAASQQIDTSERERESGHPDAPTMRKCYHQPPLSTNHSMLSSIAIGFPPQGSTLHISNHVWLHLAPFRFFSSPDHSPPFQFFRSPRMPAFLSSQNYVLFSMSCLFFAQNVCSPQNFNFLVVELNRLPSVTERLQCPRLHNSPELFP